MSSPALPPAPDFAAWITSPSPSPTLPAGTTTTFSRRTSSATVIANLSPGLFLLDEIVTSIRTITGVSAGMVTIGVAPGAAPEGCCASTARGSESASSKDLANTRRSIRALPLELTHGAIDSVEGERVHAFSDELARDPDGRSPFPAIQRLGIQPDQPWKM